MANSNKPMQEDEIVRMLQEMPRYKPDPAAMEKHLHALRQEGAVVQSKRRWRRGWRVVERIGLAAAVVLILVMIPHVSSLVSDSMPSSERGTEYLPDSLSADSGDGLHLENDDTHNTHLMDANKDEQTGPLPPVLPEESNRVPVTELPLEFQEVLPGSLERVVEQAIRVEMFEDGHPAYIVAYRLPESGTLQVSMLMDVDGSIWNLLVRGEKMTEEPIMDLDGIWITRLTNDGPMAILIGNAMGASVGNLLEVYVIENSGGAGLDEKFVPSREAPNFRYLDTIPYYHIEWDDFDGDGRLEFAAWMKDTGNAYLVELYQFDQEGNGSLMIDENAYPVYFPQVVAYYEQLIGESPMRIYWYCLADAAAKAGQMEKAAEAVRQGLSLREEDDPGTKRYYDKRFYDLAERYHLPVRGNSLREEQN